jgi:hypothetical protein
LSLHPRNCTFWYPLQDISSQSSSSLCCLLCSQTEENHSLLVIGIGKNVCTNWELNKAVRAWDVLVLAESRGNLNFEQFKK